MTLFRANESGMSILEVMIASSVLVVLGLAFATMMTNTAKEQKRAFLNAEIMNLHSLLTSTMASDVACKNALPVGTTISTTQPTSLGQLTFAGTTLSTTAPNNQYNGWTLRTMVLS